MKEKDITTEWGIAAKVVRDLPFCPLGVQRRSGVKHFAGGAKVFVIDDYPGMCENVVVVGHHRGSGQYVNIVLPVTALEGFKARVVYSPTILKMIAAHFGSRHRPLDRECAQERADKYETWKRENRARPFAHEVRVQEHRASGLTYLVSVDDSTPWNCEIPTNFLSSELLAIGTMFTLRRDEAGNVSWNNTRETPIQPNKKG
jgi:hypothetical protein